MKQYFRELPDSGELKDHIGLKALSLTNCVYNSITLEPSLRDYVGAFLPKARSIIVVGAGSAGSMKINK